MRGGIISVALAALAMVLASCASPEPMPGSPRQIDDKGSYVIRSGGAPVLRLTVPPGGQASESGPMTAFADAKRAHRFYIWTVPNAKTLDEAAAGVDKLITSEFVGFKLTAAKDITVAGAPARQLTGTGTEADDGDPGNAEVVVFPVGAHVFAACVHGEHSTPAANLPFMMAVIGTAKAP